jgi:hypothetical protein
MKVDKIARTTSGVNTDETETGSAGEQPVRDNQCRKQVLAPPKLEEPNRLICFWFYALKNSSSNLLSFSMLE